MINECPFRSKTNFHSAYAVSEPNDKLNSITLVRSVGSKNVPTTPTFQRNNVPFKIQWFQICLLKRGKHFNITYKLRIVLIPNNSAINIKDHQ